MFSTSELVVVGKGCRIPAKDIVLISACSPHKKKKKNQNFYNIELATSSLLVVSFKSAFMLNANAACQ